MRCSFLISTRADGSFDNYCILHNIVTVRSACGKLAAMGNPAGVRRDFDALEQRRMKAVDLLRKGLSQSEVARQVGVHRQSVSRWAQQLEDGGRRSLRRAKQIGRPPRLTAADLRRVERGLRRGAEALGFGNGLWTSGRVAELIEVECGVRYHPSHVWRILRQLGWTCQRPTGRALERDEEAIRWWKETHWPALKKTPNAKAKRSSSSTRAV